MGSDTHDPPEDGEPEDTPSSKKRAFVYERPPDEPESFTLRSPPTPNADMDISAADAKRISATLELLTRSADASLTILEGLNGHVSD